MANLARSKSPLEDPAASSLREIALRRISDIDAHLPTLRRRVPMSDAAARIYENYINERARLARMIA